jgi:hypothetical protein
VKARCECGRELDVPEGCSVACPDCGRRVVAAAGDWLDALDADDMTLDGVAPAAEPEEAPEAAPPPEPAAAAQAEEPLQAEAPTAAAGRARDEDMAPGLLPFILLARDRPDAAAKHLEAGIRSTAFIVQTAVALVVMWVLGAVAVTYASFPWRFDVVRALATLVWFLVEFAAAGIIVVLLCRLFQRETGPLGAAEGIAVVRVVSLALMAPIAVALVVAVAALHDPDSSTTVFLQACVPWVSRLGALVIFVCQTALLVRLLKLGCWLSFILSLVVSYGAAALASKVALIF